MASKFVKSQEQISLAVNIETGEMQRMAYDPNFTQVQKHRIRVWASMAAFIRGLTSLSRLFSIFMTDFAF